MMTTLILIPLCVMGVLGLVMAVGLGLAAKKLAVETDPRIELLTEIMPGANCGACGFAGCSAYAKAIVEGGKEPVPCPVGGDETAKKMADILGIEPPVVPKTTAKIFCCGDISEKRQKGNYEGVKTCASATLVAGGTIMCSYGCLGFGDCVRVCQFGAMKERPNLPPEIDEEKCTSCGLCVKACPRNLIKIIPKSAEYVVACSSLDRGKYVKRVCDTGCTGCKLCVKKCPNKAITVENNLAIINYELCKNAGECYKACPQGCIIWKNAQKS